MSDQPKTYNKRVRIICPDGFTHNARVEDAETGEPILNVHQVDVHLKYGDPLATVELRTYMPRVDVVADATITTEETPTPAMRHKLERDAVYAERDKCVSLLARMALKLGYTAGIGTHLGEDWDELWRHVIYIDLPNGQVSWHIPDSETPLFDFLPQYEGKWDGHTTAEKYERVVNPGF
jgi:hypothetical protein